MTDSYACSDYPGMETCAGRFEAESHDELWQHIELHASVAHGEDPGAWSADDVATIKDLIKS
jgi:predicted small metal-binding protein